MNNHLLSKIESLLPTFSKGQRLIASYITEHYDKAAFMTASKLGTMVGVSESTVVRFAAELGYEGYPQLQRAMQEMIRAKLTTLQRMEVSNNRIDDNMILEGVLNQDIEKIKRTLESISQDSFYQAVEAISKARKIYIIGVRSSQALANFLGYNLKLIFDNVHEIVANSETSMFEQMIRINEEDVVIGISFPRYSKRVVRALRFAYDRHATIITLTDSMASPLIQYTTHSLLAKSDMVSFADSLVAPLSVINALIVAVAMKHHDSIAATLKELEHIWEEYQVYETLDNK